MSHFHNYHLSIYVYNYIYIYINIHTRYLLYIFNTTGRSTKFSENGNLLGIPTPKSPNLTVSSGTKKAIGLWHLFFFQKEVRPLEEGGKKVKSDPILEMKVFWGVVFFSSLICWIVNVGFRFFGIFEGREDCQRLVWEFDMQTS